MLLQRLGELPPLLGLLGNLEIFYFPHMLKFLNFEFIFAIRGLKLAKRSVQGKLIKHKIGGFFLLAPLK